MTYFSLAAAPAVVAAVLAVEVDTQQMAPILSKSTRTTPWSLVLAVEATQTEEPPPFCITLLMVALKTQVQVVMVVPLVAALHTVDRQAVLVALTVRMVFLDLAMIISKMVKVREQPRESLAKLPVICTQVAAAVAVALFPVLAALAVAAMAAHQEMAAMVLSILAAAVVAAAGTITAALAAVESLLSEMRGEQNALCTD